MGNGHSELCEIYECIALHEWEIYVGKIIYSIIIYPFHLWICLDGNNERWGKKTN